MNTADTPPTAGTLYIVATPIGNRADISFRAVDILRSVDLIAAEDTRHARPLLAGYNITTPLTAYHEHNEREAGARLIRHLASGRSLALIADAGTPSINDPGVALVRTARDHGIDVVPIPGCCALVAALSVSGLATDRFSFEGFPPRNAAARRAWLEGLVANPRTTIFYESSHRIRDCLLDVGSVFPPGRKMVVARELTKLHETIIRTTAGKVDRLVEHDAYLHKGELVVLIEAARPVKNAAGALDREQHRILALLLRECSLKTAVALAADITHAPRKAFYRAALTLQAKNKD